MQNEKTVTIIITEELHKAANDVTNGVFIKLALDVFNLDLNKISIHIDPECYTYVYDKNVDDEVNIILTIKNGFHIISMSNIEDQYPHNINRGVNDESR